jgi:hypothetical protein
MKKFIFSLSIVYGLSICAQAQLVVTNASDSGPGSLRQAITDADSGYTITFDNNYVITLNSELILNKDITIDGGSHVISISGNNSVRVFNVPDSVKKSELKNLTIMNGNCFGYGNNTGGGILNKGNLSLTNCIITNCTASSEGGGICNNCGCLSITTCSITYNTAKYGGAIRSIHGISNTDSVTINDCSIYNNSGEQGGAIHNFGVIVINNSRIFNNTSTQDGGAIWNNYTLTIRNSCLYSNTAEWDGGALDNLNAEVDIINSTISGNKAKKSGGGIANGNAYNSGILKLFNCTITNNIADIDKNNDGDGGGVVNYYNSYSPTEVDLSNTLIALNIDSTNNANDIAGVVNGNNYNLIGNITGAIGTIGTGTDIINNSPNIDTLQDMGGGTMVHALLQGSPAIDAGNPAFDVNSFIPPLLYDQRGNPFSRIIDGNVDGTSRIDIGAFEYVYTTGVSEQSVIDITVRIYPNPADDFVYVNFTKQEKNILRLYDINDKLLFIKSSENSLEKIDISKLPKGIYLLNIIANDFNITKRITKY